MDDDNDEPPANRTIQIDALTDVSLVDDRSEPAPAPGRAPPPLPPRKPNVAALAAVVIVTGVLGAAGAYFFIPPAEVPPAEVAPAAPAAEAIHDVRLDEAFMIHAGPEPDAGISAVEEP